MTAIAAAEIQLAVWTHAQAVQIVAQETSVNPTALVQGLADVCSVR